MRTVLCSAAVLLVTTMVVASGTPTPAREGARAPERLRATGLYVEGSSDVIAPENRPFSPQYPLWTDGAEKARWVYLPAGEQIDASNEAAWDFPVGAKFWKEFRFAGRKVETRMIWRAEADHWVFATYVWNADGSDASLAPAEGVRNAAEIGSGKWHTIPAASDCTACHGTTRPGPLGFNPLQLSPDRDPNALHGEPLDADMVTLDTLLAEGWLRGAAPDLGRRAPRIASSNPRTRAILGYLVANCGSCHNGRGEIAALAPVLRYEDLVTDADAVAGSLVGQRTKWQVPGRHEGSVLIDALAPEQSALLARLRSRSPSSQMPPLGTVLRDNEAVQAVTDWISRDLAQAARLSRR